MRRVLHVCDFSAPYPGAFIRQLRMLDEQLRARGCAPSAFAFPERAAGSSWMQMLRDDGCTVHILPEPTSRAERRVARAIEALVLDVDPFAVHTHFGTFDLSATAAVRSLRATDAHRDLRLVWHYRTALECQVDARSRVRRMKDLLKYAHAGRYVDRCVSVTQALAEEVVGRGFPPERSIAVVAGCDTDTFRVADEDPRRESRDVLGIDPQDVLILHLGWHWYRKGGDLMAEAARLLALRGHDNLQFRSVGADAEHVEVPVRRLEPTDAIHELHAASDMFISASRSEGFGNGLVEAMSCERVAVAALVDGQREVFDDLDGVITVRPDDAAALADGIERMLARRHEWRSLGAANRARIVGRHSMRRWARDMANVYSQLYPRLEMSDEVDPTQVSGVVDVAIERDGMARGA